MSGTNLVRASSLTLDALLTGPQREWVRRLLRRAAGSRSGATRVKLLAEAVEVYETALVDWIADRLARAGEPVRNADGTTRRW